MYFQILKLVLWPKNGGAIREVVFEPGMVNVITGSSKTGKSAVIPIIDYCLASRSCTVPVGVIRDKCSWFGVVVETVEGQKLFARREPGDQVQTNEMFVVESEEIALPSAIDGGNTNAGVVRGLLDRLAGLTQLDFEPETEYGYKQRPSFRDLTSLVFQPQNIVANPNVLFYKADSNEHREKLRTVLPYVLNAVTAQVIALRHESDRLSRRIKRLEAELREMNSISARRMSEGRRWVNQGRELGLSTRRGQLNDWPEILAELQQITLANHVGRSASVDGIEATLSVLSELRSREQELAAMASGHRQRLMELKRLREGSDEYAGALRIQRDRISLSSWMSDEIKRRNEAALLFSSETASSLDKLSSALKEVEGKLQAYPLATTSLDAEYHRQRVRTEEVLAEISIVRQEIRYHEAHSEAARQEISYTSAIDRFLGGLQQLLDQYELSDASSEHEMELSELRDKLSTIDRRINEAAIQRRLDSTLDEIQQITGSIIPALNAEWGESPVRLDPKELTVRVSRQGRKDYLWEIGSGANWLAYHVAVTLALHTYFLSHPPSPVPGLIVYDQPSQVYFPAVVIDKKTGEKDRKLVEQEDVQAVRSIFAEIGNRVVSAKGALQVIILDHANQDVWGELEGIFLVEEWRGKKLVPLEW